MSPFNLNEFQKALTDQYVKGLQGIQTTMGIGVIMFAFIVYVLQLQQPSDNSTTMEAVETVQLLTLVHLFFAISCYVAAVILYNRFLAPPASEEGRSVQQSLAALRTATIVRLALCEAPAFFGLVICMVAAPRGVLSSFPEYWANTISTAIVLCVIIVTFPTKAKLEYTFSRKIAGR